MQITAITQHGVGGWPTSKWGPLTPGLNVLFGPPRSGKTTLGELLAHTLFGKHSTLAAAAATVVAPPGEVFVDSDRGQFRVRRYRDDTGAQRLTVAGFDNAVVDSNTMGRLVGGLPPAVLSPLCAVDFRESPEIAVLLSEEFAVGFETICRGHSVPIVGRTAELAARRDQLAKELETRIAGERQASVNLEARCRELERLIRGEQEQLAAAEQRLRATETALAETDARLRYRRLELHIDRTPHEPATTDGSAGPDEHVRRVRAMLAELAQREAHVRADLTQLEASQTGCSDQTAPMRAWLGVGRQLSADLAGEVARLARAGASQQCACHDAHPRLRPISEMIERQLDALSTLIDEHHRSQVAAQWKSELDQLSQSQDQLRRHLDKLLERSRSRDGSTATQAWNQEFSAADAQQLESRRLELEQQRFHLVEEIGACQRRLRDARAQRETVDRQRAALLSARSIDHVQRELATVQQKLEQSAGRTSELHPLTIDGESPARASDYLAQLTDGELVRLALVEHGRRACVVNRAGQTLRVESLPAAERGLVYLSLCLALLSAARRQGAPLPLVLDEPFERLDARRTAALAAVLGAFSRQGHQVVVLTGQHAALERLASVGASVAKISDVHQRPGTAPADHFDHKRSDSIAPRATRSSGPRRKKRRAIPQRESSESSRARDDDAPNPSRSDAA